MTKEEALQQIADGMRRQRINARRNEFIEQLRRQARRLPSSSSQFQTWRSEIQTNHRSQPAHKAVSLTLPAI